MTHALSRIHVKGFRSLRDVTLQPGRLTVLIGPNGAGKSNLLSALQMLPVLASRSLSAFVGLRGGASELLFRGAKTTPKLQLELDFDEPGGPLNYSATLGHSAGDGFTFLDEVVGPPRMWLGNGLKESLLAEAVSDPTANAARAVLASLSQVSFFHFHDTSIHAALRANAPAHETSALKPDGSNLATYLRFLRDTPDREAQVAWRRIQQLVQQVVPSIKELRPVPVGVLNADTFRLNDPNAELGRVKIRLDWVDPQDHVFGPHHLSDGTLRLIALITALAQPTSRLPRFISIDEPELGLHPAALALFASLARSVSDHTQILIATQSSALLDHFDADEVVVVDMVKGETKLKRLEHAALAAWLNKLPPQATP